MKRALLPYQSFAPYHCARIEPTRRVFAAAGIELLAVSLFADSRQYRWSHQLEPSVIRLDLAGDTSDRLSWPGLPRLYRALSRLEPDVVFVNGWSARDALLCHAWCLLKGIPRVLVCDSQAGDRRRGAIKERMKARLAAGCGAAFAAGRSSSRYLKSLGVANSAITIGCDVVDNSHFARARELRGKQGFRLLTVSRLIAEKNLIPAAHAFLQFCRQRGPTEAWRWTIVGYGPLRQPLEQIAAQSGGRIRLAEYLGYDELVSEYAAHDVYWQPSVSESWGLVVNEAMASAMPVLVSRQCGCAEDLVTADTGWVFDARFTDAMVDGLERAAADRGRWRAMGEAAAEQISHWDLDRFARGALDAAQIALGQIAEQEISHGAGP